MYLKFFIKLKYLFVSCRPLHSIKNLLIFLPILASNNINNIYFFYTLYAFIFLCLITSATYLLNDIFDLKYDINHNLKKFRPLASQKISILDSILFAFFLIIISFFFLNLMFSFEIISFFILYIFISITYSIFFKKLIWIDTVILASLFTLRVYLGNLVTFLDLSFWLITFSFFFF